MRPDTLEVEFEIRDCFEALKSAAKTVDIRIDELSSVKFKSGIFGDTIRIQSERMQTVSDIPGSQQGAVNLYTKKADAETAQEFVEHLNRLISPAAVHTKPVAPVKTPATGASVPPLSHGDYVSTTEQLKVPAIGMLVSGLMHLILCVFLFVTIIRRALPGVDQVDLFSDQLISVMGEYLYVKNTAEILWSCLISFGFALVLLSAAYFLFRQRSYFYAMFLSILACLPIHPLVIVTLPIGLWALVVLDKAKTKRVFHENAMATPFPARKEPAKNSVLVVGIRAGMLFFFLGFCVIAVLSIILLSIWRGTDGAEWTAPAPPPAKVMIETELKQPSHESNVDAAAKESETQSRPDAATATASSENASPLQLRLDNILLMFVILACAVVAVVFFVVFLIRDVRRRNQKFS